MRTLKRVAAGVSCATILTALGTTAFIANAQETVDLAKRQAEFDSDVVNIIADQVYAAPGESVSYNLNLIQNEGFASGGVVVTYDSNLIVEKNGTLPKAEPGEASLNLVQFYALNEPMNIISIGTVGTSNSVVESGVYATLHFVVPENAQEGDKYPISVKVDRWLDYKSVPVSYYVVNGWIEVVAETTTESATTTESETTTTESSSTTEETTLMTQSTSTEPTTSSESETTLSTTSFTENSTLTTNAETSSTESIQTETTSSSESATTSSVTETTVSTESTTSSTSSSSVSVPTQTNKTEGTVPGTEKTTARRTTAPNVDPGKVITTTAPGAATGDSGVGLSVAALATAAATAIAVSSKRKDK